MAKRYPAQLLRNLAKLIYRANSLGAVNLYVCTLNILVPSPPPPGLVILCIAEKPSFTSSGLSKAFPKLDDSKDVPDQLVAMKMTPDGTAWWLVGQTGHIREVRPERSL